MIKLSNLLKLLLISNVCGFIRLIPEQRKMLLRCSNNNCFNERKIYAKYLLDLRKSQKIINNITKNIPYSSETTETLERIISVNNNKNVTYMNDNLFINNDNFNYDNIIINNNLEINVKNVKYIKIETKNDTLKIKLDNDNKQKETVVQNNIRDLDLILTLLSIFQNLYN